METFRIATPGGAEVIFKARVMDANGSVDSYQIHLRAQGMNATAFVENPGYGHPPTQLFSETATSWTGWNGQKAWDAMEGELRIEATSDSLGHITFKFMIPGFSGRTDWSATASVVCEAGQLQGIANEAKLFFSGSDA